MTNIGDFAGTNGSGPQGNIVMNSAGDILANAAEGGANGVGGVVFKLTPGGGGLGAGALVV